MAKSRFNKGNLQIPKGTIPLYVEPAIVVKVKTSFFGDRFLFAKPPKHPKSDYEKLKKESDLPTLLPGQEDTSGFEGLQDKLEAPTGETIKVIKKKPKNELDIETWLIEKTFDQSQEVLARPFVVPHEDISQNKPHPFLLQVATFEKIKTKIVDGSEGNDYIKILKIGYMYKDDIFYANEKFKTFTGPLFNHRPTAADIVQGTELGDCFLLAGIAAILEQNHGADFIMNMMRQQDDGTTIVKLYDPRTEPPKPIYVQVENSIHHVEGESAVLHKEPWIHILEKAYAGVGFKKVWDEFENKKTVKLSHQSFRNIYGDGGVDDIALKILTGLNAKKYPISLNKPYANIFLSDQQAIVMSIAHTYNSEMKIDKDNLPLTHKKIWLCKSISPLIKALDGNAELLAAWGNYITTINKVSPKLLFQKFQQLCKNSNSENEIGLKTREEITALIDELKDLGKIEIIDPKTQQKSFYVPPIHVLDKIKDYLLKKTAEKIIDGKNISAYTYSGRIGTGYYIPSEIALFETLFHLHKQGHLLTAVTFPDFKNKFDKDKKVFGLISQHDYAITNVHISTLSNGKNILLITLRNPWGTIGRVYDFAKDAEYQKKGLPTCAYEEENRAEFDIDINDFMRYFLIYTCLDFNLAEKIQQQDQLNQPKTVSGLNTSNNTLFSTISPEGKHGQSNEKLVDIINSKHKK